jgi:hypothetical protein
VSVVFTDTFTVGSDTELSSYPSAGAPDYARISGTGTFTANAVNDYVRAAGTSTEIVYRIINAAAPTGSQEITVDNYHAAGNYETFGACVRCASTADAYVAIVVSGSTVELYRMDSGTMNLIATASRTNTMNAVVACRFKAVTNGSQVDIEFQANATAVVTYSDTSGSRKTSGTPGLWSYFGGAGFYADNISLDDLTTGTAVSPIAGQLALTGNVQQVVTRADVSALSGSMAYSGNVVAVSTDSQTDVVLLNGSLRLSGNVQTVVTRADVSILSGSMAYSGKVLTIGTGVTANKFYSTTFPLTENPISESGVWANSNNGTTWGKMESSGGNAYGLVYSPTGYHDNYMFLKNYGFGPDQEVSCVIYMDSGHVPADVTTSFEYELLLRFGDTAGTAYGYECGIGTYGGPFIVRWNGPNGNFLEITSYSYNPGQLSDGDILRAKVTGSLIQFYRNDVLIADATDTTYSSGEPGIGLFNRHDPSTGSNAWIGFKTFTATNGLWDVSPLSGGLRYGGNVVTVTTRADVTLAAGSLTFAGGTVSVSDGAEVSVLPVAGVMRFTGLAPTIATRADIAPINGAMLFTGQLPDVRTLVNVSPLGGTMNLTGQVVGAIGGSIVTVSALAGETRFSGAAMTVQVLATYAVTPSTGAVQFAGQVPTVTLKIPFGWVKSGRNARTWTKTSSSGAWVQR